MSKRYYLCDMIQHEDPMIGRVPSVFGHANYVMVDSPAGDKNWALVLVVSDNHARIAALKGVDPLPDVSLDTQFNSVDKTKSDAARAALQRRGVAPPSVGPGEGFRHFLRGVGRKLDPNFNEDNFDVSE